MLFKNKKALNAVYIGLLCSLSYLAVYFARNVLSTVTPQMIEDGYSEVLIGKVSSVFFTFYAFGQLINGFIGDKIKSRYMISFGLLLAGVTNILFVYFLPISQSFSTVAYGLTGFFLSMIYAPMTKIVAENTLPEYAVRCSLGYTFSSFIGSPLAGIFSAILVWQSVFFSSSITLIIMAIIFFLMCLYFEKNGIVTYNKFVQKNKKRSIDGIKVLLKRQIIKYTFISILTGITRTTVVFWLPTYIAQHLGFSAETSSLIFTVATLLISFSAFIAIFVYERLHRNMDLSILVMFIASSVFFLLVYFINKPVANISFLILAILSSNCAATILWSMYCPSLYDTGMVSTATGYLDFVSYIAASVSSTLFANAVTSIGWSNLILIWFGLMVLGIIVSIPIKFKINKKSEMEIKL